MTYSCRCGVPVAGCAAIVCQCAPPHGDDEFGAENGSDAARLTVDDIARIFRVDPDVVHCAACEALAHNNPPASRAQPVMRRSLTMQCETCEIEHDEITWNHLGMLCARCHQHTGNNDQGHYWGLCKVLLAQGIDFKDAVRELHFCCPGDCELEARR